MRIKNFRKKKIQNLFPPPIFIAEIKNGYVISITFFLIYELSKIPSNRICRFLKTGFLDIFVKFWNTRIRKPVEPVFRNIRIRKPVQPVFGNTGIQKPVLPKVFFCVTPSNL